VMRKAHLDLFRMVGFGPAAQSRFRYRIYNLPQAIVTSYGS
jgi:hypothetical protein